MPPSIQTSRKRTGFGSGPAMSLAVKKTDDPMTPQATRSTESSSDRPRTSVGGSSLSITGEKLRSRVLMNLCLADVVLLQPCQAGTVHGPEPTQARCSLFLRCRSEERNQSCSRLDARVSERDIERRQWRAATWAVEDRN